MMLPDAKSSAALAVVALLVYQVGKIIYRLYFHPLRNFPGPKLAAATFWYEIYFDCFKPPLGQYLYEIDRLHAQYGPIIRCSPEEVHVKDSEWFDTLFTGPGHTRDKWNRTMRANGAPGSVASATPHSLHRLRRGSLNPYFSTAAVKTLEERIKDIVDTLCAEIRTYTKEGRLIELGTVSSALTLDVITGYSFDDCYNCIQQPDFAPHWKRLLSAFDTVPFSRHFPGLMNTVQSLPPAVLTRMNPELGYFFEIKHTLRTQAGQIWQAEHKASADIDGSDGEKPRTVFHGIMRSKLPPAEKSIDRVCDEAFVLIVAGAETTARNITVIMSYLLEDKELLSRLRNDLERFFAEGLPSSKSIEAIPLMRAVIQEGLRITAPVTNRPIFIAPTEELRYGDYVIPRGTPTSMSFQDVLYDPVIFNEPHKFNPNRWLEAEARGQRLDRYMVAFSKGSRSCVGQNLAMVEMYLTVAAFVMRFDMELVDFDRKRDLEIVRDTFVGLPSKESRGVRVKVNARSETV